MVRRIRRDVPTENSSIYTHGHLLKLDGNVSHYMSGIGTWEPLSGNATGTLPAPPDKSVQFNDGLTAFGGSSFFLFDKVQGRASLGNQSALTSNVTFYVKGNLTYNVYSDGADSQNLFIGYSGFGTQITTSATLTVDRGANVNTYNIRSKGAASANLFENSIQVLGHSAFGSNAVFLGVSATDVVLIEEELTGTITSGTHSGLNSAVRYTNTGANTPNVYEIQSQPILDSATSTNFGTVAAYYGRAYCDSPDDVGSVYGATFTGYVNNTACKIATSVLGVDANAYSNSNYASGNLTRMAGVQTLVTHPGTQTVTDAMGVWVQANLDSGGGVVNNYGIYITMQTAGVTKKYNIWSDWNGGVGDGKNFFGAGIQVGSTGTNVSEFAAGIVGIGTGASGSAAGVLRCAAAGIGGNVTGSEELTVTGQASVSSTLVVGSSCDAASYKVGGVAGVSGTFTTADIPPKTVTVTNGIIVGIV